MAVHGGLAVPADSANDRGVELRVRISDFALEGLSAADKSRPATSAQWLHNAVREQAPLDQVLVAENALRSVGATMVSSCEYRRHDAACPTRGSQIVVVR
jgi:hypothetical protein